MEMETVVGRIELQGVNGEGKFALVSLCDLDYLSQFTWNVSHGYAIATIDGEQHRMHRMVMGLSPSRTKDIEVDHKNRNPLDNTRSNLRIVNHAQNCQNRSKNQSMNGNPTTSSFKGVFWNKWAEKWESQIGFNKKRFYLGRFNTQEEAAMVYDQASRQLHGQHGNLNFPVQMITINYNYYSGSPAQ